MADNQPVPAGSQTDPTSASAPVDPATSESATSQPATSQSTTSQSATGRESPEPSPEVKARNRPSGTHYVEPSPLGIEPVVQSGVDVATNPPRSSERPHQSGEVPLGTGAHPEPPGGGGRESRGKQ